MEGDPFYLNWGFWTTVIAALALLLSQLPPLYVLFRPAKLDLDVHNLMFITHKVGNPNSQLHVLIKNVGGRLVRINSIELKARREDDGQEFYFPAQSFLVEPTDKDAALLPVFHLKPGDEWGHVVNCLKFFTRAEQREYGQLETAIRNDIEEKRARPDFQGGLAFAEAANVTPLVNMFARKFMWEPGEYTFT